MNECFWYHDGYCYLKRGMPDSNDLQCNSECKYFEKDDCNG